MTTITQSQLRINIATDKVVDYMYKEEDRHFRESLDSEDYKDSVRFIVKLKEHIVFQIIVLKLQGDEKAIKEWVDEYWDLYGEPDDEDYESDYESANCEICCENFLLDKLEIIDDKFYCRLCIDDVKPNMYA
jgi:hypothetical protein